MRQVTTLRCSKNPDGGRRLSGSPESCGKFLREFTFHFKEELLSLPDKLIFPTIPPFGALKRDNKHMATAIDDCERSWP